MVSVLDAHKDNEKIWSMEYSDDFFDRLVNEIPELDLTDSIHETFLVKVSEDECYVVQLEALKGMENPFTILDSRSGYPTMPLKVSLVGDKKDVEDFLNEYQIPFSDLLQRVNKL